MTSYDVMYKSQMICWDLGMKGPYVGQKKICDFLVKQMPYGSIFIITIDGF